MNILRDINTAFKRRGLTLQSDAAHLLNEVLNK